MSDSRYLHDLKEQPEALARSLAGLRPGAGFLKHAKALQAGDHDGVVLTGMGASLGALLPLHLELLKAGHRSWHVESAELISTQKGLLQKGRLVLAVSQSGASGEILQLLELCRGKCPVLGVSNQKESRLCLEAQGCLLTQAGEESTVSCKTYVASLAVLHLAAEWLLGGGAEQRRREELRHAGEAMRAYLADLESHTRELAELLEPERPLFYLGRGYSLASTLTGALITKEACRCPSEGMSCAAFRHGPMELCGTAVQAVIFSGLADTARLNLAYSEELRAAGLPCHLCGPEAETKALRIAPLGETLLPLLEILPVQAATLALARRKQITPGVFSHARKITTHL